MSTADIVVKNPRTGAEIRLLSTEGDVEIYFANEKRWNMVFRWRDGTALFKTSSATPEILKVAFALASILGAEITDDDGGAIKGVKGER